MSDLIHAPHRQMRIEARLAGLVISAVLLWYCYRRYDSHIPLHLASLRLGVISLVLALLTPFFSNCLVGLTFTNWQSRDTRSDHKTGIRRFKLDKLKSIRIHMGSYIYGIRHANMGWRECEYYTKQIDKLPNHRTNDGRLLMYMRLICSGKILLTMLFVFSIATKKLYDMGITGHYTDNTFIATMSGLVLIIIVFAEAIGCEDSDTPTIIRAWSQAIQFRQLNNWVLMIMVWMLRLITLVLLLFTFGAPTDIFYQIPTILMAIAASTLAGYMSMLPAGILIRGAVMIFLLYNCLTLPLNTVIFAVLVYRICEVGVLGVCGVLSARKLPQ